MPRPAERKGKERSRGERRNRRVEGSSRTPAPEPFKVNEHSHLSIEVLLLTDIQCGPQQPGCGFHNIDNILKQWPKIKHIPWPEPDGSDPKLYEQWSREYKEWFKLKCGIGLGYFCRMHGRWVPCGMVEAKRARTREDDYNSLNNELGCPDSHYVSTEGSAADNEQGDTLGTPASSATEKYSRYPNYNPQQTEEWNTGIGKSYEQDHDDDGYDETPWTERAGQEPTESYHVDEYRYDFGPDVETEEQQNGDEYLESYAPQDTDDGLVKGFSNLEITSEDADNPQQL
ncbi:hypothetical protein QBC43DRAFT_328102 [Cladorrhinum sp. PSN259]|nr:hypothetical protein QBC43DRAFT_328102 [Cladorrhinum sp. PSN259]